MKKQKNEEYLLASFSCTCSDTKADYLTSCDGRLASFHRVMNVASPSTGAKQDSFFFKTQADEAKSARPGSRLNLPRVHSSPLPTRGPAATLCSIRSFPLGIYLIETITGLHSLCQEKTVTRRFLFEDCDKSDLLKPGILNMAFSRKTDESSSGSNSRGDLLQVKLFRTFSHCLLLHTYVIVTLHGARVNMCL